MDHARPERLGELVRALLPIAPELEVHTEAQRMAEVAPGSTVVLVPREADTDWLNLNRPIFASRQLRVVLFCTREVSVALSRGAVDFVDWMSLRVDCPPGPAPFAVAGIRAALAVRAPGIVWAGGDLETAFAAARPRRKLCRVSAARPYEELVAEAKDHRGEWIAWTEVDGDIRLRRVRWALAEARRRTPSFLEDASVRSEGWSTVHGRMMALDDARAALAEAGAHRPGRLAALLQLEPESVQLSRQLLEKGVVEATLEKELREAVDPGRRIGELSIAWGLNTEDDRVRQRAAPPVMRAFGAMSEFRSLHASRRGQLLQRMNQGEPIDAEDAVWWSAWSGTRHPPKDLEGLNPSLHITEALLRSRQRTGEFWEGLTNLALSAGDMDVARAWAQRTEAVEPARWGALVNVLREEGRLVEAETLLRHQFAEKNQLSDVSRSWLQHMLAYVLHEKGENAEAEKLLRQALSKDKKTYTSPHPDIAASRHLLAQVLSSQGKYFEAEKLLRQALATTKTELGERSPAFMSLLGDLSDVLEKQGRYPAAEKVLHECLALEERTLGPSDPAHAHSLYKMAWILRQQGKFDEAEKALLRALSIQEQALGPHHPDYARSLHDLAILRIDQERLAEADALLLRSRTILEQTTGPRSSGYASSLHELARVRRRQGRFTEAEASMRQALALDAEIVGSNAPEYARHLHQLALILEEQGRYAEAQETLRQSLSTLEKAVGTQHIDLAPALHILGALLAKQQRFAEAEPLMSRASSLNQRHLGEKHPYTALTFGWLARIEYALNRKSAAKRARRAITALRDAFGPEHPITQAELPHLRQIIASRNTK